MSRRHVCDTGEAGLYVPWRDRYVSTANLKEMRSGARDAQPVKADELGSDMAVYGKLALSSILNRSTGGAG